jgi:hypothetical protein
MISNEFTNLCKEHNLGKWNFIASDFKAKLQFSEEEFYQLNDINPIYSGQKGGLVIGKLHSQGGIHLILPNVENKVFTYVAEMEGWEYLSSPIKSEQHKNQLLKINSSVVAMKNDTIEEFEIPENCKVIDTSECNINIILLSYYSQFIINRKSTKENIHKIIELESKNSW